MNYVTQINEHLFLVYSDMACIDFYVYVWAEALTAEAMKIVEAEIDKWISEDIGVGFIECVKNALEKKGIIADYYGKVE